MNEGVYMYAGIETIILIALFAVSAAVSYSGYQKAKKAARAAAEKASGVLYQSRVTAAPRRLVYGQTRVGGLEAYFTVTGTDNEYLHFVLLWSEGPNEAIDAIYFDGVEIPLDGSGDATGDFAGFVHIESELGDPAQTAIAAAVSAMPDWNSNSRLLGICYSWIQLKYDAELFPNGAPSISALISGRNDIYNIADDVTEHTNNVACCMTHYMCLANFGMELDIATTFYENDIVAAINSCDQDVALSIGGTEKRYTFNGIITLDEEPESILDRFLTAMAGNRLYAGGKWHIRAGEYFVPTFDVTEDMIVGPVLLKTTLPKVDRINEIRGVYVSAGNNYFPTDFPAYTESEYVTDDGEVLPEDIELVDTNSLTRARRIAKIFLKRARYSRRVEVPCNIEALQCIPGKPVSFTYEKLGFTDVPMDVESWSKSIQQDGTMEIKLSLKETNSAIYAWDEADDRASTEPSGTYTQPAGPSNNFGAASSSVAGGLDYGDI
jgi:hypothetical protein